LRLAVLLLCLAVTAGCGNESLFGSLHKESASLVVRGIADGQVILPSDGLTLQISSQGAQKSKDLDLEITVYSTAGEKLWSTRMAAPVLNEPLPVVQLPDLPPGQYRLETVITSAGEDAVKQSAVFFSTRQKLRIAGIESFPPVITSSSMVLLKAVLDAPAGVDSYLRWSWRGATIAAGLASKGYGKVLWEAPGEEGVYTITLELFPVAPGSDGSIPYRSSISMSTDVYVSKPSSRGPDEIAAAGSYIALYRFQGSLKDDSLGKRQPGASAVPVGSPELVTTARGFGYKLTPGSGLRIPWLVLPVDSSGVGPFTLSLGVSVEEPSPGAVLASLRSADGALALELSLDETGLTPQAAFTFAGGAEIRASSGSVLAEEERHLLSLSIVPLPRGFTVQWFVNGIQTAASSFDAPLPTPGNAGETLIGGTSGFTGVVDLLAVFTRDTDGRPSADPGLFARSAALSQGDELILAEGFDGISLPAGFVADGSGWVALGAMSLRPGSSLSVPPLGAAGAGVAVTIGITADSAAQAVLHLSWEGEGADFYQASAAVREGRIRFILPADRMSIRTPDGQKTVKPPSSPEPSLVIRVSNPRDAKADLAVQSILVLRTKEGQSVTEVR